MMMIIIIIIIIIIISAKYSPAVEKWSSVTAKKRLFLSIYSLRVLPVKTLQHLFRGVGLYLTLSPNLSLFISCQSWSVSDENHLGERSGSEAPMQKWRSRTSANFHGSRAASNYCTLEGFHWCGRSSDCWKCIHLLSTSFSDKNKSKTAKFQLAWPFRQSWNASMSWSSCCPCFKGLCLHQVICRSGKVGLTFSCPIANSRIL